MKIIKELIALRKIRILNKKIDKLRSIRIKYPNTDAIDFFIKNDADGFYILYLLSDGRMSPEDFIECYKKYYYKHYNRDCKDNNYDIFLDLGNFFYSIHDIYQESKNRDLLQKEIEDLEYKRDALLKSDLGIK